MPPKAIFKGHTFALSGKLSKARQEYADLIAKYGGAVANTVNSSVTYLISTGDDVKAQTQKVVHAQGREIPIVVEGFLGACITDEAVPPDNEAFFNIKNKKRKAPAAKPKAKVKVARAKKAEVKVGPIKTSDMVEVIAKSGLVDKAKVVQEAVEKGFVKATLTWDVELVLHDPDAGKDRFYNMQLLCNKEGTEFHVVQNWGKTGYEGAVNVDGPFGDLAAAKKEFKRKFRMKTGTVWGSLGGSFVDMPGKYKLLAPAPEAEPAAGGEAPAQAVREAPGDWQYYLHNKVDGKKLGWYDYDRGAGANMEKYWRQFSRDASLNIRLIQGDYFKYEVDFSAMIQRNIRSGMRRAIRRLPAGEKGGAEKPEKIPEPAAPAPDWKAAASSSEEEEESEGSEEEEEEQEEEEEPGPSAAGRAPPPAPAAEGRAPPTETMPVATRG